MIVECESCQKFQTLARVRRTNKGKFRAVSDSLCCGTVHLTLTHTDQGTQGASHVAEVRIPDSSSHISHARSSSSKRFNKLRKDDHVLRAQSETVTTQPNNATSITTGYENDFACHFLKASAKEARRWAQSTARPGRIDDSTGRSGCADDSLLGH